MFLYVLIHGKRLHAYHWEEKPIDQGVVDRVEELAELEKQPLHSNNHPLFEWLPRSEIEVEDHENLFDVQNEIPLDVNNDVMEQ